MDGWQHSPLDYDPATDGDEAQWGSEPWPPKADRAWHSSGVWVTIGNRRVRRWAVRRPCTRPWPVHDRQQKCGTDFGTSGRCPAAGIVGGNAAAGFGLVAPTF